MCYAYLLIYLRTENERKSTALISVNHMKKTGCSVTSQQVLINSGTTVNSLLQTCDYPHCSYFVPVEYRAKLVHPFPQLFPWPVTVNTNHQRQVFLRTFNVFISFFLSPACFSFITCWKIAYLLRLFSQNFCVQEIKNGDSINWSNEAHLYCWGGKREERHEYELLQYVCGNQKWAMQLVGCWIGRKG